MLTFEEAKKIGIKACADKLGIDFVRKYEDRSCVAYGDEEDHAFCFVGVIPQNIFSVLLHSISGSLPHFL